MQTHSTAESCEEAFVVERGERVQLLHGGDERLERRRVHEIEGEQVVDAHGLELEHGAREVRALDLGHRRGEHLVAVRALRVQAEALAGPRAARAASALLRLRLADGRDRQLVHTRLGVVHL